MTFEPPGSLYDVPSPCFNLSPPLKIPQLLSAFDLHISLTLNYTLQEFSKLHISIHIIQNSTTSTRCAKMLEDLTRTRPNHRRKISTDAIPALREKLGTGSNKAVNWIGNQIRKVRRGSDSESDDSYSSLWVDFTLKNVRLI